MDRGVKVKLSVPLRPTVVIGGCGSIFTAAVLLPIMGWDEMDEPPGWVAKAASEDRAKAARGQLKNPLLGNSRIYNGDTYVYKVEFTLGNHGHDKNYYRQLKSDYFDTTSEEGTCPNCQAYVRRMDGDDYLTCHRCGWQYQPLTQRLKNKLPL
jgi:hypothetical protein